MAFPKCGLPLLWFQYNRRNEDNHSDFGLFNTSEILTNFLKSPVILTAQKRQTTIWECLNYENFVVIVSKIIFVKVGWGQNVTNKSKFNNVFQGVSSSLYSLQSTVYSLQFTVYSLQGGFRNGLNKKIVIKEKCHARFTARGILKNFAHFCCRKQYRKLPKFTTFQLVEKRRYPLQKW